MGRLGYVILDLEWNGTYCRRLNGFINEIIEIGAIKLNGRMELCGSFHEVVKPQVYQEMHRMTRQLLHMDMEQLQEGDFFPGVCRRFLSWCSAPAQGDADGEPAQNDLAETTSVPYLRTGEVL